MNDVAGDMVVSKEMNNAVALLENFEVVVAVDDDGAVVDVHLDVADASSRVFVDPEDQKTLVWWYTDCRLIVRETKKWANVLTLPNLPTELTVYHHRLFVYVSCRECLYWMTPAKPVCRQVVEFLASVTDIIDYVVMFHSLHLVDYASHH